MLIITKLYSNPKFQTVYWEEDHDEQNALEHNEPQESMNFKKKYF